MVDSPASSTTYTFNMDPLAIAVPPTVNNSDRDQYNPTTATSGGDVTSRWRSHGYGKGVCWSTSINPTTADSHTADGSGTGVFVAVSPACTGYPLFCGAYA